MSTHESGHDDHGDHVVPASLLWGVFGALVVLTGVTYVSGSVSLAMISELAPRAVPVTGPTM